MEHKIIVVGIGPGSPDYLLPAAKTAIDAATAIVGSQRALADYGGGKTNTMTITGKIAETMAFIRENLASTDVTVMVSGDPGYYSLLSALRKEFPSFALRVIPGISSMQLAFSRLALPWQNATLISLHGRTPDLRELTYQDGRILGFLTDTVYHSHEIAGLLKQQNWPLATKVFICTRLSYDDEQIIETDLIKINALAKISHCIMVVIA